MKPQNRWLETQEIWLDHSTVCESCGVGRPRAVIVANVAGKLRELAVCKTCQARFAPQTQRVIAEQ